MKKQGLRRIRTIAAAGATALALGACSSTQSFNQKSPFPSKSASGTYDFSKTLSIDECSATRQAWIESNFWKQIAAGKDNILSEEAIVARRGDPDAYENDCTVFFGGDINAINPNNLEAIPDDPKELDTIS